MQCGKCSQPAVLALQHGNLCKKHFLNYFEDKVFKTINRYRLIGRAENLCVATSGGKDSLTVLHLTQKYLKKYKIKATLFALAIDEGIADYREKTLSDLQEFCKKNKVQLKIVSFKEEFGLELNQAFPKFKTNPKKKPCNVCGVWRRYLLNKYAKKFGANLIITGHNLDDEAQVILMNIFKANTKLAGRLGPVSGTSEQEGFIQRVKPLYFCTEKEVRLYAYLKGFKVHFAECPYSSAGYRYHIQTMLNDFENQYAGTKQGIINSFLDLLPQLKKAEPTVQIKVCKRCQELANQDVCNACKLKEAIHNE